MKETAKHIRFCLKCIGITSKDVSVICKPNYTIHVKNKTNKISFDDLLDIVKQCYYSEHHNWLLVCVDGFWI